MMDEAARLAEEQNLLERENEMAANADMEEGEIPNEDLPDGSLTPESEDKDPPESEDKGPPESEDKGPPELEDKGPPESEEKGPPESEDKGPHPLEYAWTFWFDSPAAKSRNSAWGTSIRPIYTFQTVEDFWSLYNNIHRPSKLAIGTDFNCFKDKIEPKWEDPVCANGGKWTIICSRGRTDTIWEETLMAMIGEQFHYGDEICGAVVNVRVKQDKISLWTKNSSNEVAQMSIGRQWKELLDYKDPIGFISHADSKEFDRHAKNKYTV